MSDVFSDREAAAGRVSAQPRKKKTADEAKIELYGSPQAGDGTLARKEAIRTLARMREILAKQQQ